MAESTKSLIELIDAQVNIVNAITELHKLILEHEYATNARRIAHIKATTKLVNATSDLMATIIPDIAEFVEKQAEGDLPTNVIDFRRNNE